MSIETLTIRLFDPGMTDLHRLWLAGLYMTLSELDSEKYIKLGRWELSDQEVRLFWNESPRKLLEQLALDSFNIRDGLIGFAAHRSNGWGFAEKVLVHDAILRTFLQHGRTRKKLKKRGFRTESYENEQVVYSFDFVTEYNHRKIDLWKLFDRKGSFQNSIKLAGWLVPGGAVRHVSFSSCTSLEESPSGFLSLLFAPAACVYFLISHKNRDGKFDSRKGAAINFPEVKNLRTFSHAYKRYLHTPVSRMHANSLGDASLMALVALNTLQDEGPLQALGVQACETTIMGTVGWSKQQKSRTGVLTLKNVNTQKLNQFDQALRVFPNRPFKTKDGSLMFHTSTCRGFIADNLATGRAWFYNFSSLMQSKKIATNISYEKKGLNIMIQETQWDQNADKLLVEAVHKALRNRYGRLAAQAKKLGEPARFDREFERVRTSLMRAKNRQTMRAELADLFARGGINGVLQENWKLLLPLFTGPDWQRAKDLALLALASYQGKGLREIEDTELANDEADTEEVI